MLMEHIHRTILNNMSEAVYVVDRGLRITYANPAAETLTGYGHDESVGTMCHDIFCERSFRCASGCPPRTAIETATPILHREAETKTRSGEVRQTQISISPFFERGECQGAVIVIKDITELRQAEESVKRQNKFLTTVIDSLPHPFCVIDAESLEVKAANAAACDGPIPGGLKCYEMSHHSTEPCSGREHPCPCREVRVHKLPVVVEHTHVGHDGIETTVEVHGVPVFDERQHVREIIEYSLDVSERKRFEKNLKHLAYFDQLTGVANRTLFFDRLGHEIKGAARNSRMLAVLFMDLDRFKAVNDSFGHDAGDLLLKESAERIASCLRASDTLARIGGDEFAVILSEIKNPLDAKLVAKKIAGAMDEAFLISGNEIRVGVSVGISICPDDGTTADELMKKSDIAMYKTKLEDGEVCSFYSEG